MLVTYRLILSNFRIKKESKQIKKQRQCQEQILTNCFRPDVILAI